MKNLFVVLLLILVSTCSVNAQIDKGTRMVSGDFAIRAYKDTYAYHSYIKKSSFNINGGISWGIAKNWLLGTYLGAGISNSMIHSVYFPDSIYSNHKTNHKSIGLGVDLKRFFALSSRFHFYIGQSISGLLVNQSDIYSNYGNNQSNMKSLINTFYANYAISPGFMYFTNKKWAFSASIRGLGLSVNFAEKNMSYDFNLNNNFNLSNLQLGVSYFWNKGEGKK